MDTEFWVPTRLLYVGGSDDPRLVEMVENGIQEPYAALSHMWGDASRLPPLRTILSKYDDMKMAIPVWMLSKNFADAINVTRQLGLRYIWIDSLCIIQDSPTDWQKEAFMMHKVYRYAEVTIVAYVLDFACLVHVSWKSLIYFEVLPQLLHTMVFSTATCL